MKSIVNYFVCSMILLFCISDLQAQYTVFKVTGTVEMSIDGKKWNPLKRKEELKGSYMVRLSENSSVDIVDSKNLVYSYTGNKAVSVDEIIKQKKTVFDAMNEKLKNRSVIGGVERLLETGETTQSVSLRFKDTESGWYDDDFWDMIPVDALFFIAIVNNSEEDKTVNVYQQLENGELIPCFSENILIENNTSVEIEEMLFVKQENSTFIVKIIEKYDF